MVRRGSIPGDKGGGRGRPQSDGDPSVLAIWGTVFPRKLAKHFRVTALDNRGAGRSSDEPSLPLTFRCWQATRPS